MSVKLRLGQVTHTEITFCMPLVATWAPEPFGYGAVVKRKISLMCVEIFPIFVNDLNISDPSVRN